MKRIGLKAALLLAAAFLLAVVLPRNELRAEAAMAPEITFTIRLTGEQEENTTVWVSYANTPSTADSGNELHNGDEFGAVRGSSFHIWVRVPYGYELADGSVSVTKDGSQDDYNDVFDGAWNIDVSNDAPSEGLWYPITVRNDYDLNRGTELDLNLYVTAKDDPARSWTEWANPGLASSFSVQADSLDLISFFWYEDSNGDRVLDGSETENNQDWFNSFEGNATTINAANRCLAFNIIIDPGFVMDESATITITADSGDPDDFNYNGRLKDFMSDMGPWFTLPGSNNPAVHPTYTISIQHMKVREMAPEEYLGTYLVDVISVDYDIQDFVDFGTKKANGDEIPGTYANQDTIVWTAFPDDATELFISIINDSDRYHFETGWVEEFDIDDNLISTQYIDNAVIRDEATDSVSIDSDHKYIFHVIFSPNKRVYWEYGEGAGKVQHATIELLEAEGNDPVDPSAVRYGEDFSLPVGTKYYFRMIPDYGYQVAGLVINNTELTPIDGDANMGIFSFTLGNADFCLTPSLTESEDEMVSDSDVIGGLFVEGGETAGIGGNFAMTVSDAALDVDAVNHMSTSLEGAPLATISLSLEQVVSKGNGEDWRKSLNEVPNASQFMVVMEPEEGLVPEGDTIRVIQNIDGVYTDLGATYDNENNLLYFQPSNYSAPTQSVNAAGKAAYADGDASASVSFTLLLTQDNYYAEITVFTYYENILGREPSEEEIAAWADGLMDKSLSLANVLAGFFNSPEFMDKEYTPEEIIAIMYEAILYREGSEEEIAAWAAQLSSGKTICEVLAGFVNSPEAQEIYGEWGLDIGGMYADGSVINPALRAYVEGMYRTLLERTSEDDGFYGWLDKIVKGTLTPAQLPQNFFGSMEYLARERTNEQFVTDCYKAILGRDPEEDGAAGWLALLEAGTDRMTVVNAFTASPEFQNRLMGLNGIEKYPGCGLK